MYNKSPNILERLPSAITRPDSPDKMPVWTWLFGKFGPVLIIYRVQRTWKSQMTLSSVELDILECLPTQSPWKWWWSGKWDKSNRFKTSSSASLIQIQPLRSPLTPFLRFIPCQNMSSLQKMMTLKLVCGRRSSNSGPAISLRSSPLTDKSVRWSFRPESSHQLPTFKRNALISPMTLGISEALQTKSHSWQSRRNVLKLTLKFIHCS